MNIYQFHTPLGYYVYAYIRKDGTPYYIGKGKGRRAIHKHNVYIPDDLSRIVVCEQNLTEIGALALERRLIAWYGRVDDNTGCLRNLTSGGEGVEMTAAIRNKISQAHKGRRKPFVSASNIRRTGMSTSLVGTKQSADHKAKRSQALTGRQRSMEHCESISKSKKGKPLAKLVCRIYDKKEMSMQHFGYWVKTHPGHLKADDTYSSPSN